MAASTRRRIAPSTPSLRSALEDTDTAHFDLGRRLLSRRTPCIESSCEENALFAEIGVGCRNGYQSASTKAEVVTAAVDGERYPRGAVTD
jgi:hypothetical protein